MSIKYLDNDELTEQVLESQKAKQPTEKLCFMLRQISTHLLGDSKYRRYSKHMKEDMCSEALVKCLKNVKNFKPEKGSAFNYMTRCTEWAFWQVLAKHYKQLNLQRELAMQHADDIQDFNPSLAEKIRQQQIDVEDK